MNKTLRLNLKPMRLPIPPYPHVGRRYVTMFRKGQARLIAAFRFLRTFLIPRAGGERQPRAPAICRGRQGLGPRGQTEAVPGRKRETAQHPPLALPAGPARYIRMEADRKSRQYLCGYSDIIYSISRNRYWRIALAPRFKSEVQSFGAPLRIRPSLADSQCRHLFDHQKHTNWSQIMHESPQSARFSGLHCNACIGDILLCLFLF